MQAQDSFTTTSKLCSGTWYQMPIAATGMYCITTADLPALRGVSLNNIAIYGAPGDMLPESNREPRIDDLVPTAISILDDGDGLFDDNSRILFYAEGPHVWRLVNEDQRIEYRVHAYANNNYYYLTTTSQASGQELAPLRIATAEEIANPEAVIATHTAVAAISNDNFNAFGGGQLWMSDKFSNTLKSHTYTLSLPSASQNGTVKARYGLGVNSTLSSQFILTCGNSRRTQSFLSGRWYNTFLETFDNTSASPSLQVTFEPRENNATGYFDFIELNAPASNRYAGEPLTFYHYQMVNAPATARFTFDGSLMPDEVWDITQPNAAVRHPMVQGSFSSEAGNYRAFIAFRLSDIQRHPSRLTLLSNQNIHGDEAADLVIVTHKDFLAQAQRLADIHTLYEGLSTQVYTQEQVYNEFSSGRQDPLAIRQMMRMFYKRGTPRYLLLFGKGTYDNRDLEGAHQRTVVTYQTLQSFNDDGATYPSDDIFGFLDDNASFATADRLDIGIGRLPAKDVAEATRLVDKIEQYITKSDLSNDDIRGDWRNYVGLLADDADPSCPHDSVFASDAEILAQRIKREYPQYNIDRIFADAYTHQSAAAGSFYPDVNHALNQRINYGPIFLNYIGHGSAQYIGTERYMELSDIENYANRQRLAFFINSTCSFGHFDSPSQVSGAEAFILAENGGIATVAAARPISHNQRFNTGLCVGSLTPENRIGDAFRQAKNSVNVSHCITLFGDPALRLSFPTYRVQVTHINGRPVNDTVADTATVLSRITVEGTIVNAEGAIVEDFDGDIFPIVFDREIKTQTLANDNDSTQVSFAQQKSVLYKGREQVRNGRFSYSFIVPRDVSYSYAPGKLSHYARSQHLNADATGAYQNILFGGFNEEVEIVESRPAVQLYINDTNFRNGSLVGEQPTLFAILHDSIGINAVGSGLGHDITAVIDDSPNSLIMLNDFYEPDFYDSRGGTVRYTLPKLDNGLHTLTLRCWNIFNFSGSATLSFRVANHRKGEIGSFYCYPNPGRDYTLLRIEHNLAGHLSSALIEIYDMRGQLVRTLQPTPADGSPVLGPIRWDYRNSQGLLLPPGIYTARTLLTDTQGGQYREVTKIVRN